MTKKNWHLWAFAILVVLALALRFPFWGDLQYTDFHTWSAQSLNYATNWFEEGYFFLKGALYNQAGSVEFLDPASRVVFYTPSPFFILPVFWLSKISGVAPQMSVVSFITFLLHVLLAYGAGSLAYTLMGDLKEKYRKISFLGAAIFILFVPNLFAYYSFSYWSDLLVLPFIVYIVLLELILEKKQTNSRLVFAQQALVFFACLSDVYGFILSLTFILFLAKAENWKRVKAISTPVALALAVTVFQISKLGSWGFVKSQIFSDFGMGLGGQMSLGSVLSGIFVKHLGLMALLFLLSFGVAEYLQRKRRIDVKYLVLFFLPPVLTSFILGVKSFNFELASLKYYLPCAIFFFGSLPALLSAYAENLGKKKQEERYLFTGISLVPGLIVFVGLLVSYPKFLELKNPGDEQFQRMSWLKGIEQPEQIIFSNHMLLNYSPPQSAFLIRKPIWKFNDYQQLIRWRGVFKDVIDYPLLWLDIASTKFDVCEKTYKEFGAVRVSAYKDTSAFLFPSVEKFISIPQDKLKKCIAQP